MRAIDWLARTAMLVLAGLATLALLGTLANMSDTAHRLPAPFAEPPSPGDAGPAEVASPGPAPERAATAEPAAAVPTQRARSAVERDERAVLRWLRALTWAVLALAAVAAAGVVALARATAHLGRIAAR